jgi:hypothetical protein
VRWADIFQLTFWRSLRLISREGVEFANPMRGGRFRSRDRQIALILLLNLGAVLQETRKPLRSTWCCSIDKRKSGPGFGPDPLVKELMFYC